MFLSYFFPNLEIIVGQLFLSVGFTYMILSMTFNKYGRYYGIREKFVKDNFPDLNIVLSTVSYIDKFSFNKLPDFYKDKIIMTKNGPMISNNEFSHFKNFIGIFNGIDNNGYGILKDDNLRTNGLPDDQVDVDYSSLTKEHDKILKLYYPHVTSNYVKFVLEHVKFFIIRNKSGRGGTKGVVEKGISGSLYDKDGKSEMLTDEGSMSNWHQFVIHNNASLYWSNSYFFGKGPGIYGKIGTLIFLLKMNEVGNKWKIKNNIKNKFLGFHRFPKNSIISCHGHLLDLDENEITYKPEIYECKYNEDFNDENLKLPGYLKHIDKTEDIENSIFNMLPIY